MAYDSGFQDGFWAGIFIGGLLATTFTIWIKNKEIKRLVKKEEEK
jgi:hypothetical protein